MKFPKDIFTSRAPDDVFVALTSNGVKQARIERAEVKWPNRSNAQRIELRTNAIVRVERAPND